MPQPQRCETAQVDLTRVGYNKFGAVPHRHPDINTDYGMILGGIGSYGEDATGLADLCNRVGHCPATKTLDQTGHSGGVSEAGTMVYIVCTHYRASEFLYNVVVLVGAFGG